MKRILILLHEYQRRDRQHLIYALLDAWRERGLEVLLVYGIRDRPNADLLVPQVDLTRTPSEYVEYMRSYLSVVNRDVLDISKRRISAHLLRADEGYSGPVIVKTDNNFGGFPEFWLSISWLPLAARALWRFASVVEYTLRQNLSRGRVMREYLIFNNLAEVPLGAFTNPALVIERFLPEREGPRYFVRHYLFLGDHSRSVRVAGFTPFLKRSECSLVDEGLPVPEEVVNFRHKIGLDYGKIDYTIHKGQVVILDVNRTPGKPGTSEGTARAVRDLADGIWSLLKNT
jgi:hypothetical protein